MAKAEQFADEKARIEKSCFSKRDPTGERKCLTPSDESDRAVSERYITHIRVTEDARSPSSPPPPNSPPENKKERVILLAVKSSGLVRMHKAKENPQGSFSIGKTWDFDDVSVVESFGNRTPRSAEEAEQFRWAGETGFAVTLGKPYFWQTNSSMEKSYFIGSLVKVFKRYTEGRLPQLVGFTPAELDQIFAQVDQPSQGAPNQYQAARGDRGAAGRSLPQVTSAMPGAPPPLNARRGATLPAQERPSQPPDALRVGQLRPTQSREQVRPYTPPGRTTTPENRSSTPESQKAGVSRRGGFYQEPGPTNGLGIISDSKKTNGDASRCMFNLYSRLGSPPQRKLYPNHLTQHHPSANDLHSPPLPTALAIAQGKSPYPASETNQRSPLLSSHPTDTRSRRAQSRPKSPPHRPRPKLWPKKSRPRSLPSPRVRTQTKKPGQA
jgi:hypothetical protein